VRKQETGNKKFTYNRAQSSLDSSPFLFLGFCLAEARLLLALHVEHPVGDFPFVLRRHILLEVDHARLVVSPVAVVGPAVECHGGRGELAVLVKGQRLAHVAGTFRVDIALVGPLGDLVTHRPGEAHALGPVEILELPALAVAQLWEVGLEGRAEGVQALSVAGHGSGVLQSTT